MNKRQVFIRTLKTFVLISAVWTALLVYTQEACASYSLGDFSGEIAAGELNGFSYPLTIFHSGKLVLSFTSTGGFDNSEVCFGPNHGAYVSDCATIPKNSLLTFDHLASGAYNISFNQWNRESGTFTIHAVFTDADDNLTEAEPNDTKATATPLTDIRTAIGYTDNVFDYDHRYTDWEDWFRYEVTHSGKLVLNFIYKGTYSNTGVDLLNDNEQTITSALLTDNALTSDHLAPGTYYIRVVAGYNRYGYPVDYGTYTIQAVFTPDISAIGLQDAIVCLRILSGIPVSSSEIIITDISKDGRIGMEECIYILQVVAGLRP